MWECSIFNEEHFIHFSNWNEYFSQVFKCFEVLSIPPQIYIWLSTLIEKWFLLDSNILLYGLNIPLLNK